MNIIATDSAIANRDICCQTIEISPNSRKGAKTKDHFSLDEDSDFLKILLSTSV
jgi:hypothetical protein